jgi:hypothetical protein
MRSAVTPAASCTLPPSTAASTMAAVLSLSFSLSMVSRSVLASAPSSVAASTLMPLTSTAWATARRPARSQLALERGDLLLQRAHLLEQPRPARRHLGRRGLERAGHAAEACLQRLQVGQRVVAGDGLDAAHAGGDAAFGHDLEQADVAGALHVRAAAQLVGCCRCLSTRTSSPYFSPNSIIAPLFCASSIGHHLGAMAWLVGQDLGVDDGLDLADLLVGQRRVVREVEARALGVTSEPFCCTWRPAPRAAPCASGGWRCGCAPSWRALGVDAGDEFVAHLDLAFDDAALVAEHARPGS